MSALISDVDLAERWGLPVARLHRLRREKGLPCVKFSRTDIRFTEEQVEQIVGVLTVTPGQSKPAKGGQTSRSAAREKR